MAQTGSRSAGTQSTPPADPKTTETAKANATPDAKTDADRVKELEAEVKELRERLAAAHPAAGRPAMPGRPTEPSFRFTEGMAHELRTIGRTVSPFNGKRYVGSSAGDAREASLAEFLKATPAEKS